MSPQVVGFSLTIVAAVIWGINGTLVQFLITDRNINIEWLVTVRLLIPGLLLLTTSALTKSWAEVVAIWNKRKDALALVSFSFALVAVQYTFFAAIKASNAATATIIQFTAPVMIAVYYAVVRLETPSYRQIGAMTLALIGTFLLVTKGNVNTINVTGTALFWALTSAIALAIYSIQPIRLLREYPANVIIGWGMLLGGIAFSAIHAPWAVGGVWDFYTLLNFAFIILMGSLVAFSLYLRGVKLIGGYITSLLTSFEPLAATALSILWLKISFGQAEVIGGLLIVATVFLLAAPKSKKESTEDLLQPNP